jgi:hypothetical protein
MNVFDDPCYLLITILAVFTALFLRRVVQERLPLPLGFAAALQFVTSLLVASLMILHTVAVIAYRITERKAAWATNEPHITYFGIPYDFRIYSLVLLGVLTSVLAGRGMAAANALIQGNRAAFAEGIRLNLLLLVVSIPAVPLQRVAVMVVVPAAAAIAVLHVTRKLLPAQVRSMAMASAAAGAK